MPRWDGVGAWGFDPLSDGSFGGYGGIVVIDIGEIIAREGPFAPGSTIQTQDGQVLYTIPFPPPAGGPEDRGPPIDFDQPPPVQLPPPSEPPPVQPPSTQPPPIEGEYIPATPQPTKAPPPPIEGIYESFPARRPKQEIKRMPGEIPDRRALRPDGLPQYERPKLPPLPPGVSEIERILRRITRGAGRTILGPLGGAIGPMIDIGRPEVLGSGELPFPPIPRVDIPASVVELPTGIGSAATREPPTPVLSPPAAPDVVVVEAPRPQPPAVPGPALPQPVSTSRPWWEIISAAIIGRAAAPISRPISRANPTPLPLVSDPLTPNLPLPGTDPLTPPNPTTLPSPTTLTAGTPLQLLPSEQTTDRCRCKKCEEKKTKKRKRSPSSTVASVHPFSRRMSNYSLKNLRKGKLK